MSIPLGIAEHCWHSKLLSQFEHEHGESRLKVHIEISGFRKHLSNDFYAVHELALFDVTSWQCVVWSDLLDVLSEGRALHEFDNVLTSILT